MWPADMSHSLHGVYTFFLKKVNSFPTCFRKSENWGEAKNIPNSGFPEEIGRSGLSHSCVEAVGWRQRAVVATVSTTPYCLSHKDANVSCCVKNYRYLFIRLY